MATLFAMMHRAVLTFIVLVFLAPLALAQDGRFTVTGLEVSGTGDSVTQAQERAVRQALRDGFAAMLAGLGEDAAGVTPDQVSDGRIAGLVTALNATDETVGDGSYAAVVTISFNPDGVLSLIDSLRPPPEAAPPAASATPPAASGQPETDTTQAPEAAAPAVAATPTPAQRPEAPSPSPSDQTGGETGDQAGGQAGGGTTAQPSQPPAQTATAPIVRPPNPPLPGRRPAIPAGVGGTAQPQTAGAPNTGAPTTGAPINDTGAATGGETLIPLPQTGSAAAPVLRPVVQPPTAAAPNAVVPAGGPVLLVALWRDESGVYLWDSPNPWREAWLNFSRPSAPVEIIQPFGDIEDAVTVTAEQAAARNMPALTSLARRYGAAEILLASARRGSGAVEIDLERMTTSGRTIAENTITAPGTELTAYYLGVEAVANWLMGVDAAAGPGLSGAATALPPGGQAGQPINSTGSGQPWGGQQGGGQLGTGTTSVDGISATVLPPPGQSAPGQSAPGQVTAGQPSTGQPGGIGLSGSAFTGGVASGNSPTVGVLGSIPQGTPLPQVQQLDGLPGVAVATPGSVAAGPSYTATVPIADRLDWTSIRSAMQGAPGVLAVNTLLVTQTRANVSIVFQGSEGELRSSLNSVGLDLGYDQAGVLQVRRR
ncbi:MAG: DUF2066 domain-containing protein [Azospirillaceae bacterium]